MTTKFFHELVLPVNSVQHLCDILLKCFDIIGLCGLFLHEDDQGFFLLVIICDNCCHCYIERAIAFFSIPVTFHPITREWGRFFGNGEFISEQDRNWCNDMGIDILDGISFEQLST